jgi:hypothetical protein
LQQQCKRINFILMAGRRQKIALDFLIDCSKIVREPNSNKQKNFGRAQWNGVMCCG